VITSNVQIDLGEGLFSYPVKKSQMLILSLKITAKLVVISCLHLQYNY